MKGVIRPGVSAGSNQVGASEMCTPQVSCPSDPPAQLGRGAPAKKAAVPSAISSRRDMRTPLRAETIVPVSKTDFAIACSLRPLWWGLAFTVEQPLAGCLLY